MFNVDLLKGQGIPVRTSPAGIAIMAAGIVAPFVIAIVLISIYLNNRITIPIMERELAVCVQKMQTMSEGVKVQQEFDREKGSINKSVPEIAVIVRRYTAWSPIIRVIAENMPGVMVLSRLDGRQTITKNQESTDSKKGGDAVSVKREVAISISGSGQVNCDEEVKTFRGRLLECSTLKSRLQDIPVSQQSGKSGEKDAVSYDMRMIFKDGM